MAVHRLTLTEAQKLLEYEVNVNALDKCNRTPLSYAFTYNKWDTIKTLLDHGASLKDLSQEMPLRRAVECYWFQGRIWKFLAHRADINERDTGNRTPLYQAILRGNPGRVW